MENKDKQTEDCLSSEATESLSFWDQKENKEVLEAWRKRVQEFTKEIDELLKK